MARFLRESANALVFVLANLVGPAVVLIGFYALVMGACRGDELPRQLDGSGREIRTDSPDFRGVRANAPIPPEMHLKNTVGTDGSGLCVPSSITINGRYQGVPGVESILERARQLPGGYGPDKLAGLLRETVPGEKYASYVGTDLSVLDKLSADGYPIGATMNTGSLYYYQPIHHMISLTHFDRSKGLACVVDNNQPGVFTWMRDTEFARRWIDGGTGWAFVWLRKARDAYTHRAAAAVLAASLVFAALWSRRVSSPGPLDDEEADYA